MNPNRNNSRKLIVKVIIDVCCLLIVGLPILIFFLYGKPYKRGFFCDDDSLRHPYLESTVSSWVLYVFGLGLPIVVIIFTEFLAFRYSGNNKRIILDKNVPNWFWESYRYIGIFGFGAACSQLTTDIAKYTIGRLRPHFYAVCQPDIDCSNPKYENIYIEHFNCLGKNEKLLKDMRLSFPSGHSSFSTYCMLFLVAYLQAKLMWKGSKLLKHTLQFIAIMLAFYTALSRISDYKHHWSDVLAGSLQGAIVAVLIVKYVSDLFPQRYCRDKNQSFATDTDQPDNHLNIIEEKTVGYRNNRVL